MPVPFNLSIKVSRRLGRLMSLDIAEWVSSWSNWLLLTSLVIGVVSTFFIVLSGNVKEANFKERIAGLQKETADANKAAAEARLELERMKAPRELNATAQARLSETLTPFAGQQYSFNVFPDPESIALMRSVDGILKRAGWTRIPSQLGAIEIDAAGEAHDVGVQIGIPPNSPQALQQLATLLSKSLGREGISAFPAFIADLKINQAININVGKKP